MISPVLPRGLDFEVLDEGREAGREVSQEHEVQGHAGAADARVGRGPGALGGEHAARRGVDVTVLLEQDDGGRDRINEQNRQVAAELTRGGVKVLFDSPRTTTHVKAAVIDRRLVFLGGADTPQQSLGWIPGEVATSLVGGDCLVGAWGDAALWSIKKKLCSPEYETPLQILDAENAPVLALKASSAVNRLKDLKLCFTSLKACKDLTLALGSAILGAKICAAAPLPLWGSQKTRKILADHLSSQGGTLEYFDHSPQAQEILDWFLKNDK